MAAVLAPSSSFAGDKIDVSGFYVGGTAGMSTSQKYHGYPYRGISYGFPYFPDFRQASPTIGVIAGYNFVKDNNLLGLEFRLNSDLSDKKTSRANVGWGSDDPNHEHTIQEIASPTFSVRIGRQFDSFLVYAGIGAGASYLKEDMSSDYHGDMPNTYLKKSGWSPTISASIGAEYHFDRYFTRVDGQIRHLYLGRKMLLSGYDEITRYEATASVGIRF